MTLHTKVLVVGGGPSGATAAHSLALRGIDVILAERNLSFSKPCGGGISSSAFEEFGIPLHLCRLSVKLVKLVSPSGRSAEIDLSPSCIFIVDRQSFDETLRGRAREAGTAIVEGRVVDIARKRGTVACTISRTEGNGMVINADYVIAADGVNSPVRSLLGIQPVRSIFTITESLAGNYTRECEFWFSSAHAPSFYSWVFPAAHGTSIGTGSFNPKVLKTNLLTFKQVRGIIDSGRSRIYRIPVWDGKLYNKGKVLFVGDAAGQVLPMSYEGIYYAMKSGLFAAEAVAGGRVGLYKKLWKSHLQKKFFFMRQLNEYFLRNDARAEKIISLHKRAHIQEAAKNLWLMMDSKSIHLTDYIKSFRKYLI